MELLSEDKDVPQHWPRVYALDVDLAGAASAVWGAYNRSADTLHLYAEYVSSATSLALHADAIRKRGSWIPGLVQPNAYKRSASRAAQLINQLYDLNLDITAVELDEDAGEAEILSRLASKRLTADRSLREWLNQYRHHSHDDKEQRHGLIIATEMIAVFGVDMALTEEQIRQADDPQALWAEEQRSKVTGY